MFRRLVGGAGGGEERLAVALQDAQPYGRTAMRDLEHGLVTCLRRLHLWKAKDNAVHFVGDADGRAARDKQII